MKKKIIVYDKNKNKVEKTINYLPVRYTVSILLSIFWILVILFGVVFLSFKFIIFSFLSIALQIIVVISIVCSNDNPDYKVPWLLIVIVFPVIGYMCYFLFYRRKLSKKYVRKLNDLSNTLSFDDTKTLDLIDNELIKSQIKALKKNSNCHVYNSTNIKYLPNGENYFEYLIKDLKEAKKFIFLEYFIIEDGVFWNSILDVLKEKIKENVEIKVIYDDIGCMSKLSGTYYKTLQKLGIDCVVFGKLKGTANSEFNHRSHRKIFVIDGKVGYTGGVNLADEYINIGSKFGHWLDTGVRLEGTAVNELTRMFLIDFYSQTSKNDNNVERFYIDHRVQSDSIIVPFGDGPKPIYEYQVGKSVIMNILNQATKYVYITTPYLIIDNELTNCIINTVKRGVDVHIIVPHIPDKKIVFNVTKSTYIYLIEQGVHIYEYLPGFIHSKLYLADDVIGMIGSINLDYRSLVHSFENGVLIYKDKELLKIKEEFEILITKSKYMNAVGNLKRPYLTILRILAKIFSPLL